MSAVGTRRNIKLFLQLMTPINILVDAVGVTYLGIPYLQMSVYDTSDNYIESPTIILSITDIRTNGENATVLAAIAAYATADSYTVANVFWSVAAPTGPSSYQTIVTQTGTSAPAVSGSLTPTSTYPSGTTFTWARTGAGVYTLTASAAVFNTSGKTGVFVGTLNNLNASCKAVVTSSTVITLTTAIGSLLGLGLLGLTATNTDALLTQTMVYVQTYA